MCVVHSKRKTSLEADKLQPGPEPESVERAEENGKTTEDGDENDEDPMGGPSMGK